MDTTDHVLSDAFKGHGVAASGLTGIKNALMKCLHFQLQLNRVGVLNVATDKNISIIYLSDVCFVWRGVPWIATRWQETEL
jgi:hypothetical protein